jgi:Flp pilus assembly pilin Flp
MIRDVLALPGRLGAAAKRACDRFRRLVRAKAGIAAVEFALIAPLLLALYFGIVVLAQGLEVGRKTQLLSRTLADLTAQTLPGSSTAGNCSTSSSVNSVPMTSVPCLADADIQNILAASTAVLYPFSGPTKITLSQVVFDNVTSTNTACCRARVVWSIGSGTSPTLRACGLLNQSTNGTNGATLIPAGLYPGGVGDAITSGTPYIASGNQYDYFLIVADVSYSYTPGFGFQPMAWDQNANAGAGYTISQTTYMTPRAGASVAQTPSTSAQFSTLVYQGIFWTPGGGISNYNACTVGAGATQYNLP